MNPRYLKAVRRTKSEKLKLLNKKKGGPEYKLQKKKIQEAIRLQRTMNSVIPHPEIGPTIKYVRYADD